MTKVYIITREDLVDYSSTIICVYSDKEKAKRKVDELNGSIPENDPSTDYCLQSFTVDSEETYD